MGVSERWRRHGPLPPAGRGAVALLPILLVAMLLTGLGGLAGATGALPGPEPSGDVRLPSGWSLHPAGQAVALGSLPENLALAPAGRWLAALNAGFGEHRVDLIDLTTLAVVARAPLPNAFYGLAFSADGRRLYVSGGEDAVAHVFAVAGGTLREESPLALAAAARTTLAGGLALDEPGQRLFTALTYGDAVSVSALGGGRRPQAWPLAAGAFPYALLLDRPAGRLYASLWGRSAVAVLSLATGRLLATWATPAHPTEMALAPDGRTLYVACANATTVSVLDTRTGRARETLNAALYPDAPAGNTPSSLALTPDGQMLLVGNADANNVAVFAPTAAGGAAPLGFIPVGWYPTAVRYDPKSRRIFVANGKGARSLANPNGPTPFLADDRRHLPGYIAELLTGTLSVVPFPATAELRAYTAQAFALSPLRAGAAVVGAPPEGGSPIPAAVGGTSPLKHVIYVVKENRTYDQVLGDVAAGNGDPKLCLFPEAVTPNHHKLAREFVLLDNFYADGEVSANGHEWSMAAYATDFIEKMWPLNYRGTSVVGYPSEGQLDAIARPAGGYLWDRAAAKGLSYLSLGEWVEFSRDKGAPARPAAPALAGHVDPGYRGFDLKVTDQSRADRFDYDLAGWRAQGVMPALVIVRLPNDHTAGTRVGRPTPTVYLADNDLALGRIVDAVSHSPFWKDTAIFVVEDDAQNGADHVDAHRTVALVISPFTKRRAVDSTAYSTSSMLRTMELILGLAPMSQFDAAAAPMYASFQAAPVLTPYDVVHPAVDMKAVNTAGAYGARTSAALALEQADANDPAVLNDLIWHAVKGAAAPMPAPVRAAFFVPHPRAAAGAADPD